MPVDPSVDHGLRLVVAVFLYEESGSRTVTVFGETPLPGDVVVWFLGQAETLSQHQVGQIRQDLWTGVARPGARPDEPGRESARRQVVTQHCMIVEGPETGGGRSGRAASLVQVEPVAPERPPLPEPPLLDAGDGVLLRRHRPEDADGIFEQCSDADMQRWTSVPVPYERHHVQGFLDGAATGWADGSMASLAVELDGRFAGTVDLRIGEARWAELGFGLHPAARGRGVMTRAARAVLRWGFDELGLVGVHWRAVVGNHASRSVAEKCGFRVEGEVRGLLVARGQRDDGWIGSLLASELR